VNENPRYVNQGNEQTYIVGRSFLETMIDLLQASSSRDDERSEWANWITELLARNPVAPTDSGQAT